MIYNHRYVPSGSDHQIFVQRLVPAAELTLATNYYSEPADLTGFSRQAFKVSLDNTGGGGTPAADFMIQERIDGVWVDKGGLTTGSAVVGEVCEHNSEDIMRWARIRIKPTSSLPAVGIFLEISGKRWL